MEISVLDGYHDTLRPLPTTNSRMSTHLPRVCATPKSWCWYANTSHPLLTMANVVCTPHIGYVSREGFRFSP